jgi:transglutaminase-like putative cysteine protease
MREANWDEIFQRRSADDPAKTGDRLSSIIPWEDWLTFAITAVVFMSVVASIDSANWVTTMPSLYPIGFSALIVGYALARIKVHEMLLHPLALLIGASLVFLQILAVVPGSSLYVRTDTLLDRMYAWWSAATQNGISNDQLPFIVLTLVLTWLGAYVSSWAIFRWRNPWLGLVPGGTALMWNISFIPGQFSYAFVVFVFGAVLLVMRLHVSHKEGEWEQQGVAYPEFISLSVLNATFWVAVVLLSLVWLMPLAERSNSANERWQNFTAPITTKFSPLARVFIGVNSKKPINVHNLKDALPFQGKINLSGKDAVKIDVKITPEMARFLREQSFDEYTRGGWKINVTGDVPVAPGDQIPAAPPEAADARQDVTINVTVEGGNGENLFSLGQPVQSSADAKARVGADPSDVASLEPNDGLSDGDTYTVTGSVNIASVQKLQAAGTDYPQWVADRYLDLPGVPDRVASKAREVTASETTPYDKAAALEKYLRTFPNDFNVQAPPSGRDSVDWFLFDLQRGYFDYHASAMAVMLRTLGIPARVATGYAIDPLTQEPDTDTFQLTQKNAFAWPEVYFPNIGWVEFSPTPSQPLINRPTSVAPTGGLDGNDDPNPRAGAGNELDIPSQEPVQLPPVNAVGGYSGTDWWPIMIAMAVIGAVAVAGVGGAKFAWDYGLRGLSRPAQLWEKTVRLAALGKAGPRAHETPREFALRLRRDVPGSDAAGYLAATYERTRFGHKPLSDDESERLESAWASLRAALLRRALRMRPAGNDDARVRPRPQRWR